MENFRIILVVTSAHRMGRSPEQTGSWLEEVVAPYYAFRDARCDVVIASPQGGPAPLDATSLRPENATASTRRYDADPQAKRAMENTIKLGDMDPTHYDAVFFAGGHGTMEDFPTDPQVKATVEYFYATGKPLAAVCHGPACLVHAVKQNGAPVIQGHAFTCFTDTEETAIGYEKAVPFLLESRLKEQGGVARHAADFAPNIVVDGHIITGQNPPSSIPVAEEIIHQLRQRLFVQHAA